MQEQKSGIEVNVVDWGDGRRNVAVYLVDLNQMVVMDATSARTFAFSLMECADFLEPPFSEPGDINPNDNSESELFFGPHHPVDTEEDEDDE